MVALYWQGYARQDQDMSCVQEEPELVVLTECF